MKTEENSDKMPYIVVGLLYTPALKADIAQKIISRKIKYLTSIALCLEYCFAGKGYVICMKNWGITVRENPKG